ncbi:MAG TPA: hypothetical protein VNH46_02360 [Gemmatimonadales bacterium]|nr:hypothetical protein [Gemmatimonadales bacterium]
MRFLSRLFQRLSPRRMFHATGVRPMGANALVVVIEDRTYWMHAQLHPGRPPEYRVWTSDIRDITSAATVVAAPPASGRIVPEIQRRIGSYAEQSGARVSYH